MHLTRTCAYIVGEKLSSSWTHVSSSFDFFLQCIAKAGAKEYTITPDMNFEAECLQLVQPGDSCYLEEGDHYHDGLTRTHGTENARITITGASGACIRGSGDQDRVLQIAHDYYTVQGLCFNGEHKKGVKYAETAIYALGADKKSTKKGVTSSVTGLQLFDLEIRNFASECVHFRYFVTHAEVKGCIIQYCGIGAFGMGTGGKVGEAIYVGTALDQVGDDKVSNSAKQTNDVPVRADAKICSVSGGIPV